MLDPLNQERRRVIEKQVRLVEKEDHLRLVEIARFRQRLEKLGQKPQQEGRIEKRLREKRRCRQNINETAAACVRTDPVVNGKRGLTEE